MTQLYQTIVPLKIQKRTKRLDTLRDFCILRPRLGVLYSRQSKKRLCTKLRIWWRLFIHQQSLIIEETCPHQVQALHTQEPHWHSHAEERRYRTSRSKSERIYPQHGHLIWVIAPSCYPQEFSTFSADNVLLICWSKIICLTQHPSWYVGIKAWHRPGNVSFHTIPPMAWMRSFSTDPHVLFQPPIAQSSITRNLAFCSKPKHFARMKLSMEAPWPRHTQPLSNSSLVPAQVLEASSVPWEETCSMIILLKTFAMSNTVWTSYSGLLVTLGKTCDCLSHPQKPKPCVMSSTRFWSG